MARRLPRPKLDKQQARAAQFLRQGRRQVAAGESTIAQGVALARHCGMSYERIASEIGMTAPGVRKKYSVEGSRQLIDNYVQLQPAEPDLQQMTDAELDAFYGDAGLS